MGELNLEQAVANGMLTALHARNSGALPAVTTGYGSRSFAELNANVNRLVRLLRSRGLKAGDAVAVVSRNRCEFVEALFATTRSGMRFTPINFHLTGPEIGYIVDNCDASAFIADATLGEAPVAALAAAPGVKVALSCGGALAGFESYERLIETQPAEDIDDPQLGSRMLYTSGTTGRPKGVYRRTPVPDVPQWDDSPAGFQPGRDRTLVTGPGYHAAPMVIDILAPLSSGVGIVMMDKWDAEETLRLIEEHQITHAHMVATMFHRLLRLPDAVKARYSVASLKRVIHGAAPCPVHVKRAMIEWFGPVLWEYYAATEGGGGFLVGSEEWLRKPGTVGRPGPEFDNKVLDEDGQEVAAGTVGTVYMRAPANGRFEYFKDPAKTSSSYRGEYFTLGDLGYFDEDGYLFLTGRSAELIISGGVNIYPQEVDAELLRHEAVHDVCTFGVPNDEWGESVLSVVALNPGYRPDAAMSEALMSWCRDHLAAYKCPREIRYAETLPRSAAGKIQRKQIRSEYLATLDST
ncbi:MAG: AMP-binding protein [Pseudomonadota bacterium]